ncbi:MAG: hypothetical protein KAI43_05780 [Candidatus Aureabacteria bacterium]|nr:hypothetical protein [Candidatus Auribacterota bacterium]
MVVLEIIQGSANIIFLTFAIIGIIVSIIFYRSPKSILKLDKLLNRQYGSDFKGTLLDTKVDIEYIFFNHHVITAILMMIFSFVLFVFNYMVNIEEIDVSKWIVLLAFLKYFFYFFAFLGFGYGLFLLVSPYWAFILIRGLNTYCYALMTDDIENLLKSEIVEKKMYFEYHKVISSVMFILSSVLCYFLVTQMFFK